MSFGDKIYNLVNPTARHANKVIKNMERRQEAFNKRVERTQERIQRDLYEIEQRRIEQQRVEQEKSQRLERENQEKIRSYRDIVNKHKIDKINKYLQSESLINASGESVSLELIKSEGDKNIDLRKDSEIKKECMAIEDEIIKIENLIVKIEDCLSECETMK